MNGDFDLIKLNLTLLPWIRSSHLPTIISQTKIIIITIIYEYANDDYECLK